MQIALCPSRKDSNLSSMPSRVPSSSLFPRSSFYPSHYFLSEKSFTEEKPIHLSIPLWNFVRDKPPTISPTISVCRVNGKSNGCSRFCKSQVSGEETLNKDAKIVLVYDIHLHALCANVQTLERGFELIGRLI